MKKVLLSLLGSLMALPSFALEFQYTWQGTNLTYSVLDEVNKTVQVASNSGASGDLVIPETVEYNGNLFTVTKIGNRAFPDCEGLTSVSIPTSVIEIGGWAFYGCSGITSIEIPESVTKIDRSTFEGCTGLQSVTLPNAVTEIGHSAFRFCSGLTSISFPNSLTEIAGYSFSECSGLQSLTIPRSVTSIGSAAFKECTSLEGINVDSENENYSSLDGVLFSKFKSFIECFPAGKYCDDYIIPGSVSEIESYAFSGCVGLKSVTIPNSVTSININTFYKCTGLCSVSIPESVTSIWDNAFQDCVNLESIVIPNSVEIIGSNAFYNCDGMSSIILGNSVKFDESVFFGCKSLMKIVTLSTVAPQPNYFLFYEVPRSAKVYVPKGCKDEYIYTWYYFSDFIEMGELDVTLSSEEIFLDVNHEDTLKADVTMDEDQAIESAVWINSNPEVASYDDATGCITGITDGVTDITYKVVDKYGVTHSATCTVKVGNWLNSINEAKVSTSSAIDFHAGYDVYNLQGMKLSDSVDNLVPGIYIIRQGNVVKKIAVK